MCPLACLQCFLELCSKFQQRVFSVQWLVRWYEKEIQKWSKTNDLDLRPYGRCYSRRIILLLNQLLAPILVFVPQCSACVVLPAYITSSHEEEKNDFLQVFSVTLLVQQTNKKVGQIILKYQYHHHSTANFLWQALGKWWRCTRHPLVFCINCAFRDEKIGDNFRDQLTS